MRLGSRLALRYALVGEAWASEWGLKPGSPLRLVAGDSGIERLVARRDYPSATRSEALFAVKAR
jgi:hypothetical protein